MTVLKINAGFVAPGQTAKSYVGQAKTRTAGEGGALAIALETVTAKTTKSDSFNGVVTSGSKIITEVSAYPASLTEAGVQGEVTTVKLTGTAIPAGTVAVRPNATEIGKKELRMSGAGESTQALKAISAIKTLTTGKTFYITDIFLMTDFEGGSGGKGNLAVTIKSGSVEIFAAGIHALSPVEMPGIETQPLAIEGEAVTLNLPQTAAAQNVWYMIQGFEQ